MKTFTIVYRRAGFVRNLRMVVQATDSLDAMDQYSDQVAGALPGARAFAGLV